MAVSLAVAGCVCTRSHTSHRPVRDLMALPSRGTGPRETSTCDCHRFLPEVMLIVYLCVFLY